MYFENTTEIDLKQFDFSKDGKFNEVQIINPPYKEAKNIMTNRVWTIGHSTHTAVDFIKLLNQHSVSLVCDVRSQPYSKYNSQFNKDSIKRALLKSEIEYLFLGEELGGRSKNTSYYNSKGKLQYHLLAQDPLFKKGLKKIITEVKRCNIALMCSEGDPLKGHRTILVCR